jgi:hypothetical protein
MTIELYDCLTLPSRTLVENQGEVILLFLWNLKFHYLMHNSRSQDPVLCKRNLFCSIIPNSFPICARIPDWYLLISGFPTKNCMQF